MPQQDLVDSYLPSFQTCVEEGKASGISECAALSPRRRLLLQPLSHLPPMPPLSSPPRIAPPVCSYNAVNGVPSCANEWLLGTLLRESWQFDGCEC